jgi:hypothetical protein
MRFDSWASFLARTLASPCLGHEFKAKVATTPDLTQMFAYELCMKFGAMLNPFALNKKSQEKQRLQGHKGEDCITNIIKAPRGFGN